MPTYKELFPDVGAAGYLTYTSGDVVNASRVVWEDDDGLVRKANNNVEDEVDRLLGINLQAAATPGLSIAVVSEGIFVDYAWTWTPGELLFLELDGQMTHTPPATGALVQIAVALSPTKIRLREFVPIFR